MWRFSVMKENIPLYGYEIWFAFDKVSLKRGFDSVESIENELPRSHAKASMASEEVGCQSNLQSQ
jgi:hypothetical protein